MAGVEQTWTAGGWARRFDLPFDDAAHGYGQGPDEVAGGARADRASCSPATTTPSTSIRWTYVQTLTDDDLDRIVDKNWDPPVTLGVRLVSVVSDDLQHAGQAAYLRGLILTG